jgi:hypothetical protein
MSLDTPFNVKLAEMEQKLPIILHDSDSKLVVYDQVKDKEFCYKFLYCWLNNKDNQTNPTVIEVYNNIVDSYDMSYDKIQESTSLSMTKKINITFDVGFIINIEVLSEGGTTPTQKRRPKIQRKSNHTIKNRVKMR